MLALSLLVVVHEFGHYIFARIFGIKVEKFYLFFNPWFSIFKWTPKPARKKKVNKDGTERASWRDTTYGLGWLPLGGYVKIAGMIDESMDKEQMALPPKPWEFRSKPAYQRLLVMMAGVIMNFVLAIIIYAGVAFWWGEKMVPYQSATEGMNYNEAFKALGFQDGDILLSLNGTLLDSGDDTHIWDMVQDGAQVKVLRNHVDTITITMPEGTLSSMANVDSPAFTYRFPAIVAQVAGEPAESAGLMVGDRIIKVGTDSTPAYTDVTAALTRYAGADNTPVTILRDGEEVVLHVTPTPQGKLGFMAVPITDIYPTTTKNYNLFQSLPRGWQIGTDQLGMYVSSLKLLFTREGAQSVGGFGAIGKMFPDKWNWYSFWMTTAFLSVILAFMNILPIPALDGGHVLFTLYEIVTRRKPGDKFLEYAQMAGMAFLLLLLVYANGNDLYRFLFK